MTSTHPELHTSRQFQGLILSARPTSGTEDDDDNRDDEHADENEVPVRAVDEGTEAPEEFDARVNAGYFDLMPVGDEHGAMQAWNVSSTDTGA